jgi:hypothetical protein
MGERQSERVERGEGKGGGERKRARREGRGEEGGQRLEGLLVGDIVYKKDAHSIAVVSRCDGLESLLPCGVEQLHVYMYVFIYIYILHMSAIVSRGLISALIP